MTTYQLVHKDQRTHFKTLFTDNILTKPEEIEFYHNVVLRGHQTEQTIFRKVVKERGFNLEFE